MIFILAPLPAGAPPRRGEWMDRQNDFLMWRERERDKQNRHSTVAASSQLQTSEATLKKVIDSDIYWHFSTRLCQFSRQKEL